MDAERSLCASQSAPMQDSCADLPVDGFRICPSKICKIPGRFASGYLTPASFRMPYLALSWELCSPRREHPPRYKGLRPYGRKFRTVLPAYAGKTVHNFPPIRLDSEGIDGEESPRKPAQNHPLSAMILCGLLPSYAFELL